MAARPTPNRALALCIQLANNSKHRLETLIKAASNAMENNVRLTARDRSHYTAAIAVAEKMHKLFSEIAELRLPRDLADTPRKVGRPSQKEVAAAKARRARNGE